MKHLPHFFYFKLLSYKCAYYSLALPAGIISAENDIRIG